MYEICTYLYRIMPIFMVGAFFVARAVVVPSVDFNALGVLRNIVEIHDAKKRYCHMWTSNTAQKRVELALID